MKRALAAGALYFLLTFTVGAALGTVRILVAEPRFGSVPAVLLELPFLLAASWWICGRLIRYLSVPKALSSRLAMGVLAFGILMVAELGLSLFAVGGSVSGHFARYREAAPLMGLLGQMAFGAFPLSEAGEGTFGSRRMSLASCIVAEAEAEGGLPRQTGDVVQDTLELSPHHPHRLRGRAFTLERLEPGQQRVPLGAFGVQASRHM
jgi:hypothetical protein